MTNLEFNKMFITGGSTEQHIFKAVDSEGREYGYVTAEQFVRDIMGDEDVDEFLKSKEDR